MNRLPVLLAVLVLLVMGPTARTADHESLLDYTGPPAAYAVGMSHAVVLGRVVGIELDTVELRFEWDPSRTVAHRVAAPEVGTGIEGARTEDRAVLPNDSPLEPPRHGAAGGSGAAVLFGGEEGGAVAPNPPDPERVRTCPHSECRMETAVPCLPCVSVPKTLAFYQLLGFEMTYQQRSPNPYAATKRGGLDLHFFGLGGLDPAANATTCLFIVPEVQPLHEAFSAALRQHYGKLPITGFPKMTRFKPGQGRFTVTDPNGNSVIWLKRPTDEGEPQEPLTGLAKALDTVAKLRDSRGDDRMAAKALDAALERYANAPPLTRARALSARAELAVALGEPERLRAVRAELETIPLTDAEREAYRAELRAADDLEGTQQ